MPARNIWQAVNKDNEMARKLPTKEQILERIRKLREYFGSKKSTSEPIPDKEEPKVTVPESKHNGTLKVYSGNHVYKGPEDISRTLQDMHDAGSRIVELHPGDYKITQTINILHEFSIVAAHGARFFLDMDERAFSATGPYLNLIGGHWAKRNYGDPGSLLEITGGLIYSGIEEAKFHTISGCRFSGFIDTVISGHNLMNTNIHKNMFWVCCNPITLKAKCIGVHIEGNHALGPGFLGSEYATHGTAVDIFCIRKDNNQRPIGPDIDTYNAIDGFNLCHIPEGTMILNNEFVGFNRGVLMTGAWGSTMLGNMNDSNYRACVRLEGCSNISMSDMWYGQIEKPGVQADACVDIYRGAGINLETKYIGHQYKGVKLTHAVDMVINGARIVDNKNDPGGGNVEILTTSYPLEINRCRFVGQNHLIGAGLPDHEATRFKNNTLDGPEFVIPGNVTSGGNVWL